MIGSKSVLGALGVALLATAMPCWAAEVADSAQQVRPLLVGSQIPAVQLKTASGEAYDLQKAAAEKPSVLIFYRGGW